MTVVVIDARSRERNVYAASATQLPGDPSKIVLRKGVDIGGIWMLHGTDVAYPIVVVGSYMAKSSFGHVTQIGEENFFPVTFVGGAGFGFENEAGERKGDALRRFKKPLKATLLPAGVRVFCVETHKNSNVATAGAAFTGLCLRAKGNKRLFFLAEGQSDYTAATGFDCLGDNQKPEFPEEHRLDIFSEEKMAEAE